MKYYNKYSTIYAIPIHIRGLLQVYTKEVSMGSGATASSNRGSDKGPVWTRIPRNGYFLLLRYSSRFPLALCCERASLLARSSLSGRVSLCSSASFPCDCDGYSVWLSETSFSQFFFHFCVMKVEREGTYFFGVAGKLWRKIRRRRRCGSCCFSSLLFVFSTLLIFYMWCEECKWWRECFVLVEDGRYKLWRYFLVGKVWSWFCTSTYREVFLL